MAGVLSRVGKAIVMTTLTTVIGFLSFIPSPMRGMQGTGIVLSLAVTLALFYSVCFHGGILKRFHKPY